MGYVKEPKGVDFIIKSDPITEKEQAAISEFIKNYKMQHAKKKTDINKKTGATKPRKKSFA